MQLASPLSEAHTSDPTTWAPPMPPPQLSAGGELGRDCGDLRGRRVGLEDAEVGQVVLSLSRRTDGRTDGQTGGERSGVQIRTCH